MERGWVVLAGSIHGTAVSLWESRGRPAGFASFVDTSARIKGADTCARYIGQAVPGYSIIHVIDWRRCRPLVLPRLDSELHQLQKSLSALVPRLSARLARTGSFRMPAFQALRAGGLV